MAAIHYKFSSSNSYKNITFDGLNISLVDLKRSIMEKEKLKNTEGDLQITNAQSMQVYKDEGSLIPKNTSVLVRRVPLGAIQSSITYVVKKPSSIATVSATAKSESAIQANKLTFEQLTKTNDLTTANASEEDKIKAMMSQATNEYDPSNFVRQPKYGTYPRNSPQLPSYLRCHKCNQTGHYATQCPVKLDTDKWKSVRHATGIPRSQMIQVSKETRGAMLTSDGKYVVPVIDKAGYAAGKKEAPPFLQPTVAEKVEEDDEPVPDELMCLICKEILQDAVVIPCCGNSYCDECIRNVLLESEDHQCPTCHKKNISPDSLIANKFLRQAVNKFKNDTGVTRKTPAQVWPRPANVETPKPKPVVTQPTKVSYGPPSSKLQYGQQKKTTGAYVVKARSSQVYSVPAKSKYVVKAKTSTATPASTHAAGVIRTIPTTTSVANGDDQPTSNRVEQENEVKPPPKSAVPIRIKLDAQEPQPRVSQNRSPKPDEEPEDEKESSTTSTPTTNVESSSAQSSTAKEDSYTVHSTPDSDPKVKSLKVEPLPPGVSPPVAKVIRNLEETDDREKDDKPATNEEKPATLSGIEPLPPVAAAESTNKEEDDKEKEEKPVTETSDIKKQDTPTETEIIPPVHEPPQIRPPLLDNPPRPLLSIPTSQPPPNLLPNPTPPFPPPKMPPMGIPIPPPPMNMPPGLRLPPGIPGMPPPPHMFPPGIPPPGFPPPPGLVGPPGVDIPPPRSMPNLLPPGTEPPPNMPPTSMHHHSHSRRRDDRERERRRSRGRDRRDNDKPRSKLDLMSDEFTKKINRKVIRRRRPSSSSPSGSDSSSSSSQSGSYSGSGSSSSYSKSPTPVKKRKVKRAKQRKARSNSERSWSGNARSRSESFSQSRSPSKGRASKRHRDERKPRHHSRSLERHSRRHPKPNSRSPGRYRRRSPNREPNEYQAGQVVPGMPPQDVLDFQRDQALYEYYKQKYERDWIRHRVYPPSPFKRFINYEPRAQPIMHVPVYHTQGDATPTEEDAGLLRYQDRTPEEYRDRRYDNSSWEQQQQSYEQRPRDEFFENGGRRGRHEVDKRNWHKAPEYEGRDRYDRRKRYSPRREKHTRSKHDERYIEYEDGGRKRRSEHREDSREFESSSRRKKHDDRSTRDGESRKRGRREDEEVVERKRSRESQRRGGVNKDNMIQIQVMNDKRITKTIKNENVHPPSEDEADPLDERDYDDDIYLQEEKPVRAEKLKKKEKSHKKSSKDKDRSVKKKSEGDDEAERHKKHSKKHSPAPGKPPKKTEEKERVSDVELPPGVDEMPKSPSPIKEEPPADNYKSKFIPIPVKDREPSPVKETVITTLKKEKIAKATKEVKPVKKQMEMAEMSDVKPPGTEELTEDIKKLESAETSIKTEIIKSSKRVPSPITAPTKSSQKAAKVKAKTGKTIKIKKPKKEKKEALKSPLPFELPKSRWDSDTGSPDRKPIKSRLGKKGNDETDTKSGKVKKPRRIKIKSSTSKDDSKETDKSKHDNEDAKRVPDSRRVVVSGKEKPLSRQSSVVKPRPSISSIVDESSFQPNYSEQSRSDQEDALSAFADSDLDDFSNKKEEKLPQKEEEVVVKPKKKKKKKKHKKNKSDNIEEKSSQNDDRTQDSDPQEPEKKKKTKKDKSKKSSKSKKKQKYDDEYSPQQPSPSSKPRHKKVDYSDSEDDYEAETQTKHRQVQVKERLGFRPSKRVREEPAIDDQSDDSDFGQHRDYVQQPKSHKHPHKRNRPKTFSTKYRH